MSREDRNSWEARYTERAAVLATGEPSPFLRAHAGFLNGRVLDVASGAGRNALFLARRGCTVDAVDIAFAGLQAAAAEARRGGLAVRCLQVDLEQWRLPPDRYDGVINIRYLQRTLVPGLRHCLRPGGIVLFETFTVDQARIGHPRNPAFLLERGELAAMFADFELLVHEEGCFDDGAGPAHLARLVARRRAAGPV